MLILYTLRAALAAAVNQQSGSRTNQLAAGHYHSRLHYLSTFIFLTDYFHVFKHRIASLEPEHAGFKSESGRTFKNYRLTKTLPHTCDLC